MNTFTKKLRAGALGLTLIFHLCGGSAGICQRTAEWSR